MVHTGLPVTKVFIIINEKTRKPAEDIVNRVLDKGCVVNMANHTVLIHRDGREIPIEDSAAPIRDGAGHVTGVVIVFHDDTERRRAQEALRESENKLRIVTDFTYDWESWNGPDGRFLHVSPSCERITGYSREEFMRNPDLYTRIIHPNESPSGGFWEIFVEDNGIGFDERYLDKIFKPFQRLHGKNAPYEGTGIGLAICRRIAERHGGSISAKSEPGKGATFIVRLPEKQDRGEKKQ